MTRSRRLTRVETLERDIVAVFEKAVVSGGFRVDMGAAEALARRLRANGSPHLTVTHLIIKATALAALATPQAHRMFGWFRAVEPSHADVGISVAGQGNLAPVVVIRDVDCKPLPELASELRSKALDAKRRERRTLEQIERYLWLMPFGAVRRLLLRLWLRNVHWRREAFGTVQFSSMDHFAIEDVYTPVVVELLLVGGAIETEAAVDSNGQIVARRIATFRLHGSHRKLTGVSGAAFIKRFREVMASPECLM